MEEKLKAIFKKYEYDPVKGYGSQERIIDSDDFDSIIGEIVKLFDTPVAMRCSYCEEYITDIDAMCKVGTGCMKHEPCEDGDPEIDIGGETIY